MPQPPRPGHGRSVSELWRAAASRGSGRRQAAAGQSLATLLPSLSQLWPKSPNAAWPTVAKSWSMLANLGQNFANFCQGWSKLAKVCKKLANFGQAMAENG